MSDHSSDIFDFMEESQQPEEEQKEEEEQDKGSSSSEEEQVKVEDDLKEPYEKEVQRILDIGKSIDCAEAAAFNALLPLSKRRL